MYSKFGQRGLFTLELLAFIAEKIIFDLQGMLDSGERSLPFERLVLILRMKYNCIHNKQQTEVLPGVWEKRAEPAHIISRDMTKQIK